MTRGEKRDKSELIEISSFFSSFKSIELIDFRGEIFFRFVWLNGLILVEGVPHGKGFSRFELLPMNGSAVRDEMRRAEFDSRYASMFVLRIRIRIETN